MRGKYEQWVPFILISFWVLAVVLVGLERGEHIAMGPFISSCTAREIAVLYCFTIIPWNQSEAFGCQEHILYITSVPNSNVQPLEYMRMASVENLNETGGERCVSYGRGGAGNLRVLC